MTANASVVQLVADMAPVTGAFFTQVGGLMNLITTTPVLIVLLSLAFVAAAIKIAFGMYRTMARGGGEPPRRQGYSHHSEHLKMYQEDMEWGDRTGFPRVSFEDWDYKNKL